MKKHIIGLTLFSVIVSAAAVVFAVFNVPEIVSVSVPQYVLAERTHCKMRQSANRSKIDSLMVTQAVLDLKTKQINWELSTSSANPGIALHFFVKNRNGTRYVNSELLPVIYRNEDVPMNGTSSYEWLDNLGSYENLYVAAEYTTWKKFQDKTVQPKFDAEKATSVLLYSGEQGYVTEKYFRDAQE